MNTPALLVACTLLAAGSSAVVTVLMRPTPVARDSTPEQGLAPDPIAQLSTEIASLRAGQQDIDTRLRDLGLRDRKTNRASARIPVGDIQAAVASYMETHPTAVGQGEAAAEEIGTEAPVATPEALFERLLAEDLDGKNSALLWQEIRDAGLMDEALAFYEARAEEDPTDPEKRVELGVAYLNKIQEVGNGPLAGVFATKADQAFGQALEMDERNWDARFNKAVALTFWPPVFGKQTEAIKEFEILVAQQAASPLEPGHAQTHLLLGNMHRQLGDQASAVQAWQAGLALFPNDPSLLSQIELNQ